MDQLSSRWLVTLRDIRRSDDQGNFNLHYSDDDGTASGFIRLKTTT